MESNSINTFNLLLSISEVNQVAGYRVNLMGVGFLIVLNFFSLPGRRVQLKCDGTR